MNKYRLARFLWPTVYNEYTDFYFTYTLQSPDTKARALCDGHVLLFIWGEFS